MMRAHLPMIATIFCCCLLVACGSSQKKASVIDLYELPRGVHAPIDNDSYYSQPGGIRACTTINDAPSCGGG